MEATILLAGLDIESGASPPVYNSLDMSSRCARLLAVVLLATFALDVGDADCAVGARTSEAACVSLSQGRTIGADATDGCACCIGAEAACPITLVWMGETPDAVVTPVPDHVRAGVLRIPYRPPLCLSQLT